MAKGVITGKTSSGFVYEIAENSLKNYELLELIAEVDDNPLLMTKVVKLLLGDDAERLKDHVRDDNGLVAIDLMEKEITEIFNGQKDLKNS